MDTTRRKSFAVKCLDPGSRMGEILFGLIVTLTFTLAAGWLPFFFLDDPKLAARLSNVLLPGLLFYVGYRCARDTMARPWLSGAVFLGAGLALVAVTIALGG
jgi:hypothetical protein